MNNFSLSEIELVDLRSAHKVARRKSAKDAYKINVIILLGTGWTLEETSTALLLDTETLRNYISLYISGGIENLLQNNYTGRQSLLSKDKEQKLTIQLEDNLYRTTAEIVSYIYAFQIKYSLSGAKKLLHNLGFSYKKPKVVPEKLDPVAQDDFIEFYNNFMQKKSPNEVVLFYDSSHPTYMTIGDYGWIKKGKEHYIQNNVGRQRLNISGAIDIETLDTVINMPQKVNAESTIETLEKVQQAYQKAEKIHVILDNAAMHKSKLVQEYVADSKINLAFLPPYSPNLNPIERLWRLLRNEVLSNKFYKSYAEFKNACVEFFTKTFVTQDKLSDLITDNFQEFGLLNSS